MKVLPGVGLGDVMTSAAAAVGVPDCHDALGVGETHTITVTWDEAVVVTGTPALTLSNGASARYTSGTTSTALVFTYTVAEGDSDSNDLGVTAYTGTISDVAGGAAAATGTALEVDNQDVDLHNKVKEGEQYYDEEDNDHLVCACCQTDVAQTDMGPVLVYRNRTEEEYRDIYFSKMTDGIWESGSSVFDDGWEIGGCPVNGPSVSAKGQKVYVTWFTQAQGFGEVKFKSEIDEGESSKVAVIDKGLQVLGNCLLYTSPSPRDKRQYRMPSSA